MDRHLPGLVRFKHGRFEHIALPAADGTAPDIRALAEGRDGSIWDCPMV